MSLFGIFGKKSKPNLVPDIPHPRASDLYFTKPLRELASRRIAGKDLGYGEDFVSRATNPTIQAKNTRLREQVIPGIANAASARGINRSSITTDQIGKAYRDNSSEIDQLLSQFEVLNRQQSKQDQNNAIQLGREMDTQEAGMLENEANASERLVDRTVGQARHNDAISNQTGDRVFQAVGAFASPLLNDLYAKIAPNAASVTNAATAAKAGYGGASGIKLSTLGSGDILSKLLSSGLTIDQINDILGS